MTRATIAGVVAAMIGTASVSAQTTRSDIQAWPSVAVTAPVGNRLEIRADGLLQVTDDVSRVGRELLRVVVMGEVNEHLALGGGYTGRGSRVSPVTESSNIEPCNRSTCASPFAWARASSRREHGWRSDVRTSGRDGVPTARAGPTRRPLRARGVRAVVWSEYFHSINRTDWSGESGPALVLTFVGLHIPVSRRTTIEPGYLNQTNFVVGRNQARHVVAVFFAMRLSHS